jgi:hypothetical protein
MFGNKDKKAHDASAAQAALDRLLALPVSELAANSLTKQGPRVSGSVMSLLGPAQEGLQALERG